MNKEKNNRDAHSFFGTKKEIMADISNIRPFIESTIKNIPKTAFFEEEKQQTYYNIIVEENLLYIKFSVICIIVLLIFGIFRSCYSQYLRDNYSTISCTYLEAPSIIQDNKKKKNK